MKKIDLRGKWIIKSRHSSAIRHGIVPGCLHSEFITANEIPNPYYSNHLLHVEELNREGWIYETTFSHDAAQPCASAILYFDGIDGNAYVVINDQMIGQSDSETYHFEREVTPFLKPGINTVSLVFSPHEAPTRKKQLRRSDCGIVKTKTIGIFRTAELRLFSDACIHDLLIEQNFSSATAVTLRVAVTTALFDGSKNFDFIVRLLYKGIAISELRDRVAGGTQIFSIPVKNPQLWWPAGLGEQPLYEVAVDIVAGKTNVTHEVRRIGLRQIEITEQKDDWHARFNGHPIVFKGASWVPADLYQARLTRMEYARLVKAAVVANMNIFRVWGGGYYENDCFYDLCDEYGICIMQDIIRPTTHHEAIKQTAIDELERQIKRIRHHPCIATWCLGDGHVAVHESVPQAARQTLNTYAPTMGYVSEMPHIPFSTRHTPENGLLPKSSFAEPRIMKHYLKQEECNFSHPTCLIHEAPENAATLMGRGFLRHFLCPTGFDNLIWLSQILQGYALKLQWEALRTQAIPPAHFIFWRLNDNMPGCSESTLDFEGRWKAAHYLLRRLFCHHWVCARFIPESRLIELFAFNDSLKPFKGVIKWRLVTLPGDVVASGTIPVAIQATTRLMAAMINVAQFLEEQGSSNVILWFNLIDDEGTTVSSNMLFFAEPREMSLEQPRMKAEIRIWDDNSYAITFTPQNTVLWAWVSLDGMEARYDENFICLEPGRPMRIRVTPSKRLKPLEFRQLLRIGSLRDTWQERQTLMHMVSSPPAKT